MKDYQHSTQKMVCGVISCQNCGYVFHPPADLQKRIEELEKRVEELEIKIFMAEDILGNLPEGLRHGGQ